MRRGAALALLLVLSTFSGCTAVEDAWNDLKKDLEAEPKFTRATLFEETVEFSASGALDPTRVGSGAGDLGDRWNASVTVPDGTRSMRILFVVNFTAPQDRPDPLPDQEGQVRIFVTTPPGTPSTSSTRPRPAGASTSGDRTPGTGRWASTRPSARAPSPSSWRPWSPPGTDERCHHQPHRCEPTRPGRAPARLLRPGPHLVEGP